MKNPFKGKPITAEQISDVLEAHRTAGTLWGPKHVIVCYCGQQFDDDRGDGLKDMRMHTAKEIEKLQKP